MYPVVLFFSFGLATGIIGRAKGSSFFLWFIIGLVLPIIGLITVIVYKGDRDEPLRLCPRCKARHKLYVQVCNVCGEELYFPDEEAIRRP